MFLDQKSRVLLYTVRALMSASLLFFTLSVLAQDTVSTETVVEATEVVTEAVPVLTTEEVLPVEPTVEDVVVPIQETAVPSEAIIIPAEPAENAAPILKVEAAPSNSVIVIPAAPMLASLAVTGAITHTLEIDTDPYFENIENGGDGQVVRSIVVGNVPSYTLSAAQALPNGQYYWRVSHNGYNGGFPSFRSWALSVTAP